MEVDFDEAVKEYFYTLAARANLNCVKLAKGIYEIASCEFVIRIREGIGHERNIVVTLLPAKEVYYDDLGRIRGEIGLGNFLEFGGESLQSYIKGNDDYMSQGRKLAQMAERYLMPYLQDARSDFQEVKQYVEKKIIDSGVREKKYKFPRNVREEWI